MKSREESTGPDVAQSWEAYWQGTAESGAYGAGGAGHPAIRAFWEEYFRNVAETRQQASVLDIASGNGAVVECALAALGDGSVEFCCVDISQAAIGNIRHRFPAVRGVVCDARSIPLESGSFKVISSQFGLEYAGRTAFLEAARLLADGGEMALLVHHRDGVIHRECEASLDAITRLEQSRFVPLATELFQAGFAAVKGADRAPYDAAGTRLAPAVAALEQILAEHGQHVAGDTIARLYADVAHIHGRLPHYEPGEVLEWLTRMDTELEAFAARMSSMMASALDEDAIHEIVRALESAGCTVKRADPLMVSGVDWPLAWILLARRQA